MSLRENGVTIHVFLNQPYHCILFLIMEFSLEENLQCISAHFINFIHLTSGLNPALFGGMCIYLNGLGSLALCSFTLYWRKYWFKCHVYIFLSSSHVVISDCILQTHLGNSLNQAYVTHTHTLEHSHLAAMPVNAVILKHHNRELSEINVNYWLNWPRISKIPSPSLQNSMNCWSKKQQHECSCKLKHFI